MLLLMYMEDSLNVFLCEHHWIKDKFNSLFCGSFRNFLWWRCKTDLQELSMCVMFNRTWNIEKVKSFSQTFTLTVWQSLSAIAWILPTRYLSQASAPFALQSWDRSPNRSSSSSPSSSSFTSSFTRLSFLGRSLFFAASRRSLRISTLL